ARCISTRASHTSRLLHLPFHSLFFFCNDTATTEIYTLSLHDALPILATTPEPTVRPPSRIANLRPWSMAIGVISSTSSSALSPRSEEHTSELQSLTNLVCRLLLEKKNKQLRTIHLTRTHQVRTRLRVH